jgi:hypothetical protein
MYQQEKMRNTYDIFRRGPEGKGLFEYINVEMKILLIMLLKEQGVNLFHVAEDRDK